MPPVWPSIDEYAGLVNTIAKRIWHPGYRSIGMELEDAVSVGWIGLLTAIKRFDPTFGTTFSTYAWPVIAGSIRDAARMASWSPRGISDLATYRSLDEQSNLHDTESESLYARFFDEDFSDSLVDELDEQRIINLLRYHEHFRIRHIFGSLLAGESMALIGMAEGVTESRISQLHTEAIEDILSSTHHVLHRDPIHMPARRVSFWSDRALSTGNIAEHLGFNERSVLRLMKEQHIEVIPANRIAIPPPPIKIRQIKPGDVPRPPRAVLVAAYEESTIQKTAKAFHVAGLTVTRWLEEYDIEVHPRRNITQVPASSRRR